ncbi:unnamed protein product [Phaedon cochleariae]|uniref:THAP-type domain-containing protein n=1 Tax=Phaedon cochleariae TaxID=80249 RepID=A0A9P0GL90_PHACE|nr:unnamed protein product [Phaedon cochleariae]
MVLQCWICKKTKFLYPNLTFHSFPADSYDRDIWLSRLSRNQNEPIPKHARICSSHFGIGDFLNKPSGKTYLKHSALPLFFGDGDKESFGHSRSETTRKRLFSDMASTGTDPVPHFEKKSDVSSPVMKRSETTGRRLFSNMTSTDTGSVSHLERNNDLSSPVMKRFPADQCDYEASLKSFSLRKNACIPKYARICSTHFKQDGAGGGKTVLRRGAAAPDILIVDTIPPAAPDTAPQPRLESISNRPPSRGSSTDTASFDEYEENIGSEGNIDITENLVIKEDIEFEEKVDVITNSVDEFQAVSNEDADELNKAGVRGNLSHSNYASMCSTNFKNVEFELKTNGKSIFKKDGVSFSLCDENAPVSEPDPISEPRMETDSSDSNFEENIRRIYFPDFIKKVYREEKRKSQKKLDIISSRKRNCCGNFHECESDSSNTLSASENEFVQTISEEECEQIGNKRRSRKRVRKSVLDMTSSDFSTHRKAIRNFRIMRQKITSQNKKIRMLQQSLRRFKDRVNSMKGAGKSVEKKKHK